MEYEFIRIQLPCGLTGRWTEPGFRLSNGIVLLDSQMDAEGNYWGGIGMDGAYLKTGTRYRPLYDGPRLKGFQKMKT